MLSLLLPLCYNSLEVRTGAVQKCPWKYLYLFKNALESLESTRTCCVCLEDYWHGGAIVAWKVNVEMSPHAEFAHDGRKPSYNSIINHQLVVRAAGASWYVKVLQPELVLISSSPNKIPSTLFFEWYSWSQLGNLEDQVKGWHHSRNLHTRTDLHKPRQHNIIITVLAKCICECIYSLIKVHGLVCG